MGGYGGGGGGGGCRLRKAGRPPTAVNLVNGIIPLYNNNVYNPRRIKVAAARVSFSGCRLEFPDFL